MMIEHWKSCMNTMQRGKIVTMNINDKTVPVIRVKMKSLTNLLLETGHNWPWVSKQEISKSMRQAASSDFLLGALSVPEGGDVLFFRNVTRQSLHSQSSVPFPLWSFKSIHISNESYLAMLVLYACVLAKNKGLILYAKDK
jgi:hypothetical protein